MRKSPSSFDPQPSCPYQRFRIASPSRRNGFISMQKTLLCRWGDETDSRARDRACGAARRGFAPSRPVFAADPAPSAGPTVPGSPAGTSVRPCGSACSARCRRPRSSVGAGAAREQGRRPGGRRRAFSGRLRRRLLLGALLHLLRALLGDDDVALLRGLGLLVDRFQRIRPGLARRPAGAGRIELGAEFERVRQRRVGLAVDRDRLVDVLAGIAIGVERRLRSPGTAPCICSRHRESARARSRTRPGNSRRRRCARRRCGRCRIAVRDRRREARRDWLLPPNRLLRKPPGPGRGCGVRILRAAIILRERGQHRAALAVAIRTAAAPVRRRSRLLVI